MGTYTIRRCTTLGRKPAGIVYYKRDYTQFPPVDRAVHVFDDKPNIEGNIATAISYMLNDGVDPMSISIDLTPEGATWYATAPRLARPEIGVITADMLWVLQLIDGDNAKPYERISGSSQETFLLLEALGLVEFESVVDRAWGVQTKARVTAKYLEMVGVPA